MRGHVFADSKNKTVVVAIKGTSAFIVGGGTETSRNDKVNVCLSIALFPLSPFPSASTDPGTCNRTTFSSPAAVLGSTGRGRPYATVTTGPTPARKTASSTRSSPRALTTPSQPFVTLLPLPLSPSLASVLTLLRTQDLYNNISALYPHAQIWLTGHSLGGGLAAMLSRTYGVPSVSFESPGDILAARRLHLPLPPVNNPNTSTSSSDAAAAAPRRNIDDELTTHIFHTADPIPMGVCTGAISSCAIAGFALESRCHTGKTILYDTVGRLNWAVDIRTHPIRVVVQQLLKDDWGVKPKGMLGLAAGVEQTQKGWREKVVSGWGWWPGKGKEPGDGGEGDGEGGGEEDDGQNGGRGVPEPVFEDEDCSDCMRWTFPDGL